KGKTIKDIKGATLQDILDLIPKDASGHPLEPNPDKYHNAFTGQYSEAKKPKVHGFGYNWTYPEDIGKPERREGYVRCHGPDPKVKGSNAGDNWTVRIKLGRHKYLGIDGQFYDREEAEKTGLRPDNRVIDITHIPIQTPKNYICPIENPGYYGREK